MSFLSHFSSYLFHTANVLLPYFILNMLTSPEIHSMACPWISMSMLHYASPGILHTNVAHGARSGLQLATPARKC